MQKSIEIFFCYAREDEDLCQGLEKQLRALRRQGIIDLWHDRQIIPGTEWEHQIDQHLTTARIILLLISPDFMDSDYCYGIEMKRAMERHERGEARVIPIILRPVYWQKAPFGKLQALPTDAVPITNSRWHTQDEAFFDVAEGIRATVEELVTRDEKVEHWKDLGNSLYEQRRYEEALAAFELALHFSDQDATAYFNKGKALLNLKHDEEALIAFEQALRLDPNNATAYFNKGLVLGDLQRYAEALAAIDQAIRLDPNNADIYNMKGIVLGRLKRSGESRQAFARAKQLGYTP